MTRSNAPFLHFRVARSLLGIAHLSYGFRLLRSRFVESEAPFSRARNVYLEGDNDQDWGNCSQAVKPTLAYEASSCQ